MSEMSNNMKRWVAEAKEKGAAYVLDVCDSFDYDHYPIYVMEESKLQETINEYNAKDMQSVYGSYKVEESPEIESKMKELKLFKAALSTLCFNWGSDAPPEAVWAFNDLLIWLEKEYDIKLDDYLEETLENYEVVLNDITAKIEGK